MINLMNTDPRSMVKRATTFSFASQFLPGDTRCDLERLYNFCRFVDDTVDCCSNQALAGSTIDQVIRDLQSESSEIFQVRDFLALAKEKEIPISLALDLTRGVQTDLFRTIIESEEDLLRYCYSVAATVGAMICYLLKITNPEQMAHGMDLGIAMQLTNIVRDVYEDLELGRIYLPANLISREVIEASCLEDFKAQSKVFEIVRHLIIIAEKYYASSEDGICFLPSAVRLGILTASRCYRRIGILIYKSPRSMFKARVSTTFLDKQQCFISACTALSLDNKYDLPFEPKTHSDELHRALHGLTSYDLIFSSATKFHNPHRL